MIRINDTVFINREHIVEMELVMTEAGRCLIMVLSNDARYTIEGLWVGSVLANLDATAAKMAA